VRFELANGGALSTVTNCSIHSGYGWGALIRFSTDVQFNDNFVIGAYQGGLVVIKSNRVDLHRNVVGDMHQRGSVDLKGGVLDEEGAFIVCTLQGNGGC
jgi:hypothetical protein